MVEAQGGDLKKMVREAQNLFQIPEEEQALEIQAKANFQKEEELMVKMMQKMEFGDKLFGPFEGVASGEPMVWRSFGETMWRKTNLEADTYSQQVGYWTNQFVFQGLKFPLNTVNPFIEATTNFDSSGFDYKSNMLIWTGLEWRPFARNPAVYNFRPWGIPLLQWVRNYRLYLQYGNRYNLKDKITGAPNYDFRAGVDIFYEWGVDLPPIDQAPPATIPEYIQDYVWGEYYGNYYYDTTGFAAEDDYNAWTLNSSVILGIKTPAIPLPSNPLLEELVFMPYLRFEHVNNTEFSYFYSNHYFMAAGLRWMPFRSYRFKDNEWLAKVKIFGEFIGMGDVQYAKEPSSHPGHINHDLIFGIKFSEKRY